MSEYDYLDASNGDGDAPLMHITGDRSIGATVFEVDSVTNVPDLFIGTSGTLLPSGLLDPETKFEFLGHLSTDTLVIDAIEEGAIDNGNVIGDVVIIRQSTGWANRVSKFIKESANRVPVEVASSTTPTPDADTTSLYALTALAANATFGAPTGTPVDGQPLLVRIKDNATARTLAFNAAYRALGVALPTTTIVSKTLYLGFVYNLADSKWDLVALSQQA